MGPQLDPLDGELDAQEGGEAALLPPKLAGPETPALSPGTANLEKGLIRSPAPGSSSESLGAEINRVLQPAQAQEG